jgi:hypothetical protein
LGDRTKTRSLEKHAPLVDRKYAAHFARERLVLESRPRGPALSGPCKGSFSYGRPNSAADPQLTSQP